MVFMDRCSCRSGCKEGGIGAARQSPGGYVALHNFPLASTFGGPYIGCMLRCSKNNDRLAPTRTSPVAGMRAGGIGTTEDRNKIMIDSMKTAEQFAAFGKGNLEAMTQSSQIWTAGVKDLAEKATATMQSSFQETMDAFKALTSVKSLKEAIEMQSAMARSAMEKTMTANSSLTEASLKLSEQAMAPIAARVTAAVESFSKAA
jgi:phasin family protein